MPDPKQIINEYFPSLDIPTLETAQLDSIAKILRPDRTTFVVSYPKTRLSRIKSTLIVVLAILVGMFATPVVAQRTSYPTPLDVPLVAGSDSQADPLVGDILKFLQTQHVRAYDLAYYRHEGDLRPSTFAFKLNADPATQEHLGNFFKHLHTDNWLPGTADIVRPGASNRYYYTLHW